MPANWKPCPQKDPLLGGDPQESCDFRVPKLCRENKATLKSHLQCPEGTENEKLWLRLGRLSISKEDSALKCSWIFLVWTSCIRFLLARNWGMWLRVLRLGGWNVCPLCASQKEQLPPGSAGLYTPHCQVFASYHTTPQLLNLQQQVQQLPEVRSPWMAAKKSLRVVQEKPFTHFFSHPQYFQCEITADLGSFNRNPNPI